MGDDMHAPSWDRFQAAQHRLNLVKTHAHEIVGVKREQVSMVVENFSKPGTYDITVHENGRVFTTQWAPPAFEDAFVEVPEPQDVTPEEEPEESEEPVEEVIPDVIPDVISPPDEGGLVKDVAVFETIPEPENADAATPAPRRRGRPARRV
jgi:hypothetical protein